MTTTDKPTRAALRATNALQDVLRAEHAMVYAYGVIGARMSGADRSRAIAAHDVHAASRDSLEETIRRRGTEPAAAAASYEVADDGSPRASRALAAELEVRLGAVWAVAVPDLSGDLRTRAAEGLSRAAVAATGWGADSTAFPGLPDRA